MRGAEYSQERGVVNASCAGNDSEPGVIKSQARRSAGVERRAPSRGEWRVFTADKEEGADWKWQSSNVRIARFMTLDSEFRVA